LGDYFLDRGALLGIIGGAAVFIVLLLIIVIVNSDFDEQLVEKVNNDEPPEELISLIEIETQNLQNKVKRRYEANVNDRKFWGNGDLALSSDFEYFTENYENDLKMISGLDNERRKFVKGEISKKEFLENIKQYKVYLNTF
jgi:hypothetical protein